MLAMLSLATVIAVGVAPAPGGDDVEARTQRELAQVWQQARRDFEQRHAELGLLGSAPLPGRDAAAVKDDELSADRWPAQRAVAPAAQPIASAAATRAIH